MVLQLGPNVKLAHKSREQTVRALAAMSPSAASSVAAASSAISAAAPRLQFGARAPLVRVVRTRG
jgi:hypothetical protein